MTGYYAHKRGDGVVFESGVLVTYVFYHLVLHYDNYGALLDIGGAIVCDPVFMLGAPYVLELNDGTRLRCHFVDSFDAPGMLGIEAEGTLEEPNPK